MAQCLDLETVFSRRMVALKCIQVRHILVYLKIVKSCILLGKTPDLVIPPTSLVDLVDLKLTNGKKSLMS